MPQRGQENIIEPQVQRVALAKFIIATDLPLNIGEQPSYLEFIKVFCPTYQGVSRVTSRRDVLAYYHKRREALQ